MERRKRKMHILKDSKVKFVSTVGVHLLTSFWICLRFSHSSRSIVLVLGETTKPPADFKPAMLVLHISPDPADSSFFLSCGSSRMEAQSGLQ